MPTYEYECQKCGKAFEVFQPITDSPLKRCKYCNGPVRRLISSGGGIIFKGKGFYATDYRSSNYKEKQKKEVPSSCPVQGKDNSCQGCPKAGQG